MWSPRPQIPSPGRPCSAPWCQLGVGQGEAGVIRRRGHQRVYLMVRHRRSKERPPPKENSPAAFFSLFKTSNKHTQLHSDVKTLESHFWLQPTQKGLWPILPVSKKEKTITISGLMHICHARRIGGADGRDTVAGALTNVCGRLCCYLYHGETQTRNICKRTVDPFLLGVKVISKINRWD